jgi:uncharacterized protein
MSGPLTHPVVHLGLRTANLSQACAFSTRLFGWHIEQVRAGSGTYLALELAEGVQGGVVEREGDEPAWLPYVEVADIAGATQHARLLGAVVLLEPRKGPTGWRSVLAAPAGGGRAVAAEVLNAPWAPAGGATGRPKMERPGVSWTRCGPLPEGTRLTISRIRCK